MTIFKIKNAEVAFVWIWLPGKTKPIVAGRITKLNKLYAFNYGKSYLENREAMALSPLELPLKSGEAFPEGINTIHACLRDSAPDAWGRRVIEYKYAALNPGELDYMLLSSSDRIGALDFQTSPFEYIAREPKVATLKELKLYPIDDKLLVELSIEKRAFIDSLIYRFLVIQDYSSNKLFPLIAQIITNEPQQLSWFDVLALMEKYKIITSEEEWDKLRKLRNLFSHEYENIPDLLANDINRLINILPVFYKQVQLMNDYSNKVLK